MAQPEPETLRALREQHNAASKRMKEMGVRGVCQHVIFEKMIKPATSDGNDFKLMVLDKEGTRILGGICKMSEIVNVRPAQPPSLPTRCAV